MLMLDNYRWNAFTNRWVKGEPPYLWGYRWLRPDPPLAPKWSDPADIRSFLNDKWVWPEGDRNNWLRDGLSTFQLHEQHQTTMTKFKKGDRVRVTSVGSQHQGCEGIVTEVYLYNRYEVGLDGVGLLNYAATNLELVDQPLSTTPDKVLQAAKTSPQAKDALKALFPDVFKDDPVEIPDELVTGRSGDPVFIGRGLVPRELSGRCLLVGQGYTMKVSEHGPWTVLTFHKK